MSDWPTQQESTDLASRMFRDSREEAIQQRQGRAKAVAFFLRQRHFKLWQRLQRISDPSLRKNFVSEQHPEMKGQFYHPELDPKAFRQELL